MSQSISDFSQQSDGVQIVKVVSATDPGSLSQSTTDNSQRSQSILQNVNQDSNNVPENGSVANTGVAVSKTGPGPTTDVDSMDPSLVSLKRQTRARAAESRKKKRSSVLDPSAKERHAGLQLCQWIDLLGFDPVFALRVLFLSMSNSHKFTMPSFLTFNTNGLRDANKRTALLQWLSHVS